MRCTSHTYHNLQIFRFNLVFCDITFIHSYTHMSEAFMRSEKHINQGKCSEYITEIDMSQSCLQLYEICLFNICGLSIHIYSVIIQLSQWQ